MHSYGTFGLNEWREEKPILLIKEKHTMNLWWLRWIFFSDDYNYNAYYSYSYFDLVVGGINIDYCWCLCFISLCVCLCLCMF